MEFGAGLAKATNDFINLYGEAVQLETTTVGTTQDAWNDGEVAWTTSTISVLIHPVNRRDTWLQSGLLQDGDATATVKSSDTVKIRDRIIQNGTTYEVVGVETNRVQSTNLNYRVALKRHNDSS